MTDRPYLPAIESLKLCQAALERILPAEERRIILGVLNPAVMRLEQLARSDDARVARIHEINANKQLSPDKIAAEVAQVIGLRDTYRAIIKGRYSRTGAARWIIAKSGIPKKRVQHYLKEATLDRGDEVFAPKVIETA